MTLPRASAVRAALVVVSMVSLALFGCRAARPGAFAADAADAGVDAGEAGLAPAHDAGPPADDALPSSAEEDLTARGRHLLEALAHDDADLASDLIFPRDGWLLTHDGADPGKEWIKRVENPFRRAVHALARRHRDLEHAQLVSFELGHAMSQVTPRRHTWTKALWTIRDSRLTFMIDGRTRTLSVREMVAWRGAWYVTRLR